MDKHNSTQAPWNPQTPVKPIAPIFPKTAEEQSNQNQAVEGLVGNKDMTMAGLEHLPCLDLMALANSASVYFSGQNPWANNASPGIEVPSRNMVCGRPEMEMSKTNREMMQKANEAMESLSLASNIPETEMSKTNREMMQKANEAMESLSLTSNIVAETDQNSNVF